jgi:hypothetical protein
MTLPRFGNSRNVEMNIKYRVMSWSVMIMGLRHNNHYNLLASRLANIDYAGWGSVFPKPKACASSS